MENAPLFAFLDGFAADLRATSPFGAGVDPLPAYLILALLVLVALIIALIRRGARLKRAEAGLAEMEGLRRQMAVGEARAERLPLLEQALTEAREERDGLLGALNQAEAKLETVERSHTARLEELRGLNEALQGKFKTLANEVLEGNSKAFLDRVTERFATHSETAKAELDARQKAIDGMVKPLSEKLGAFDTILREMEKHRTDAYGAIREQVEHLKLGQAQLSGETRKLVQALRAPKTRGRWGEMQLRQVFELSGMAEHVDFETETSPGEWPVQRRPRCPSGPASGQLRPRPVPSCPFPPRGGDRARRADRLRWSWVHTGPPPARCRSRSGPVPPTARHHRHERHPPGCRRPDRQRTRAAPPRRHSLRTHLQTRPAQ